MKLTTFFISKTKQIYAKTLTVPASAFEIKAKPWILTLLTCVTLLTSTVIPKQRFLHKNKILQYLQYYKYQDVDQVHSIKLLQAATCHKKRLSYDFLYIFDAPFNFKLLFTFKLL